jgi:RNA polymerase primary sigma factor
VQIEHYGPTTELLICNSNGVEYEWEGTRKEGFTKRTIQQISSHGAILFCTTTPEGRVSPLGLQLINGKKLYPLHECTLNHNDEMNDDISMSDAYVKRQLNHRILRQQEVYKLFQTIEQCQEAMHNAAAEMFTNMIYYFPQACRDVLPTIRHGLERLLDKDEEELVPNSNEKRLFLKRQRDSASIMNLLERYVLEEHTRSNSQIILPKPLLRNAYKAIDAEEQVEDTIMKTFSDFVKRLTEEDVSSDTSLPIQALKRMRNEYNSAKKEYRNAKDTLIIHNLRLVAKIAYRYANKRLLFKDLLQDGTIGLMRAVDKYDYRRGVRFSTFATWWIKQAITRAIADKGRTVKVPVHVHTKARKIREATAWLKRDGKTPSTEEVAKATGISSEYIENMDTLYRTSISLSTPIGEEENTLEDFIADNDSPSPAEEVARWNLSERVDELLGTLEPREETIIRRRFGIGVPRSQTLEEIRRDFNVSRERIRQIEAKALERLRHPSRLKMLR